MDVGEEIEDGRLDIRIIIEGECLHTSIGHGQKRTKNHFLAGKNRSSKCRIGTKMKFDVLHE